MNHQLIIQFPIADASADVFDRLIMLENELELILRGRHQVDGHNIGTGVINLRIRTDDPKEAFELAKAALSKKDLETIIVANKQLNSDEYSILWPGDFEGKFEIIPS